MKIFNIIKITLIIRINLTKKEISSNNSNICVKTPSFDLLFELKSEFILKIL